MKLTKATTAKLVVPKGKSELIVFDEDMPGFGFRLRAGGSAVWIAQYRIGAKQRRVTLGRLANLDPDKARKAAREVLAKADLGQDAQAERRERQVKATVTFGSAAELYLKRAEAAVKAKTHSERQRYLLRHWRPLHARAVNEIGRSEIAAQLQIIAEQSGPISSNRARAALSAFYVWAMRQGLVDANAVMGTGRAGVERSRERVLSNSEIRSVWTTLGDGHFGCIVKLLLLTGQRRGEVAGITPEELRLDQSLWSIPASRTKNGLAHDIPLSTQAMLVLATTLPRDGRMLLFGEGRGPFSGWGQAKAGLDRLIAAQRAGGRLGRPLGKDERPNPDDALAHWTLHDLRRTVVTGMNELGIAPHVVEAVVNHVSGRAKAGVAGVYNRAVYAMEKRAALQAWADHLDELLGLGEAKVVPIRA